MLAELLGRSEGSEARRKSKYKRKKKKKKKTKKRKKKKQDKRVKCRYSKINRYEEIESGVHVQPESS